MGAMGEEFHLCSLEPLIDIPHQPLSPLLHTLFNRRSKLSHISDSSSMNAVNSRPGMWKVGISPARCCRWRRNVLKPKTQKHKTNIVKYAWHYQGEFHARLSRPVFRREKRWKSIFQQPPTRGERESEWRSRVLDGARGFEMKFTAHHSYGKLHSSFAINYIMRS